MGEWLMSMDDMPSGRDMDAYLAAAAAETQDAPSRPSRSRRRASSADSDTAVGVDGEEPLKLTPAMKRLREGVMQVYTSAQMGVFLVDRDTSELIARTKGDCVDAWMDLAQRDIKVKNMLIKLTSGAGWGGVVMAHMALVIPVLSKRGWIPGGALFGAGLMNSSLEDEAEAEAAATARMFAVDNYFSDGIPGVVQVH